MTATTHLNTCLPRLLPRGDFAHSFLTPILPSHFFRYCVHYEIVKANEACKISGNYGNDPYASLNRVRRQYIKSSYDMDHPWLSSYLMRPGQQVCATCYPKYMRPELGNRCPGTGFPGMTSRWRALNTYNCQGTFRMVSVPQRACTCRRQPNSFILT